ncbi:ACSL4 [Cordylochernes scorpioides]|uniref:ACSL4 n=1 Tax=Cordylochernes scorpioides TaxID=51811 RepID=A0ABY6LC50_9ARAC|nr:ACSL4 [Cordylochernes scorpioides]
MASARCPVVTSPPVGAVYDLSGNTAGYGAAGAYLRIVDWKEALRVAGGYSVHDRPHPRGELLVGGDCVATGYYRNAELTSEVFLEEDGVRWVRTGDIVVMERPGRFRIIDRKKDLVKLQSGEYISLGKVEAFLKSSVLVDNVWVTGDGIRDYLVAVVVPNQVRLSSVARGLGLPPCLQPEELARHPRLVARVQEDLAAWGRRGE